MTTRRSYTKTEKARVVADALNSSTKAAADRAGINESTVRYWLDDPEFATLRDKSRDAVAAEFWTAIQVGIREVTKGLKDPDAGLRDKAVALGVIYDKHALLTGGATNRSESRDITGTISDAEVAGAIRAAEAIAAGGAGRTAPPFEDAPEG